MGTNYYWHDHPCAHCGRSDAVRHICKSLRTFRGYFTWDYQLEDVPEVVSWEEWKTLLRSSDGEIRDEYGAVHDVEEFIAACEAVPMEQRRRQFDWMVENKDIVAEVRPGGEWLDADGFSFYGGEFS